MVNPEGEGDAGARANAVAVGTDQERSSYSLFRRPDKHRIGEDFNLFVKKLNLYLEAVELEDQKKRRLTSLFSLTPLVLGGGRFSHFSTLHENSL